MANRFPGCLQQGPVQVAGPAYPVWSQPNTDPVGCRSASGKNGGYAVWKLELYHKDHRSRRSFSRPGRSEPKWPSKILTLADDGLIHKISKDSQEAAEAAVQQQLDPSVYSSVVTTPDLSSI